MSIASAVFGAKKRIIFACTAIFCSTILLSTLSTPTHAQEMGASIEVPLSLTLSVPASVSMNVTPGVKDFDSKSCNIVVNTNSIAGYTLTTSATSTNLTNTTDSTKTISTLPSSSEGYTESNFVANKWGYKIGNGNYKPYVSEATLADTHEQTAGDTTALTFATKVDIDQPTGTYNLTVNFSAVAKVYVPPYMQDLTVAEVAAMDEGETKTLYDSRDNQKYTTAKINGLLWMTKNLDLAGGTTLTSADSNVSSNYTLPASSTSGFSNDSIAYVYNSGSTTCGDGSPCYSYYSYVAATAGTGASISSGEATSDICPKGWRLPTKDEFNTLISSYNTGAKLTASPFLAVYGGYYSSSGLRNAGSGGYYWSSTAYMTGYAYYLAAFPTARMDNNPNLRGFGVRCVKDMGLAMQSITVADVNSMNDGDTLDVVDSRDGKSYTTAKINGLLWMTKNLDLAGGTTLTSADSNVSSSYTLPASSTSGFTDDSTAYVYNSGSTTCGDGSPCYSYYSYAAATAGTNPSSGEATSDICPKGWRLPTKAEHETLANTYDTGIKLATAPFLGVYSGFYYNNSFGGGGSQGNYWSSAISSSSDAYSLGFSTTLADMYAGGKRAGFSVRCVKDIPTMQDFTVAEAAAMTTGDTKTLIDSRDGQDYTVAKLPDGIVWMTQNLRFTGTSIDSSTTNIDTTKTLSYGDLTSGNIYTEPRIHDSGDATTGVWYNYCAASAGTICTDDSDTTEASFSLCPAGWRLPTNSEQSAITSYSSAYSPVAGGRYVDGSFGSTSRGLWWSSTARGRYRYILVWSGSSLSTDYGSRGSGYYVRCVKDMGPAMQSITASDVNNMNDGDTLDVVDSRDGKSYTTAKINGLLWMTKNLDLAGGTTLTSADSNVSSSYTLPASSNDSASFSDNSIAYVYNSGSTTCGDNSPCYSYYSYLAATTSTDPFYYGEATSDICPKGWRLPTEGEFNTLISSYNTGAKLTAAPFLGVYGGSYLSGGKFSSGGTAGSYWTSMSTSLMIFDAQSAHASTGYVPNYGHSVRCVKS